MIRELLRRSNGWVMLRKAQAEGFGKAFQRWRLWRRILDTAPVRTDAQGLVEVRLMCYFFDYLCAIWSLKSFYGAAGVRYPLRIHIQGRAPVWVARTLRLHFPDATIVEQLEADTRVEAELNRHGWTRLLQARRANPYMQKLTDIVLLSDAQQVILLDSDVLFFRNPKELIDFTGDHIFQQDQASTYVVDRAAGVSVAPRLNAGIMNFRRASISLARCDEYLADFPDYRGWLEQTLLALHASEFGSANVLSATYLISVDRGIDPGSLTARHYAGPSRPLMTEEGMPWLVDKGICNAR